MATSFSLSNLLSFPLPSSSSLHKHPPQPHLLVPNSLPLKSKGNSLVGTGGFLSAELGSAICGGPSIGHAPATVCSCFSGFNVEVEVDEDEPEERILFQFRREVMDAGILQEVSRRRHHENAAEKKKRKKKEADRKRRRSLQRFNPRYSSDFPGDEDEGEGRKEEEDNWELPEEDITF